jgi:hypothetical protein
MNDNIKELIKFITKKSVQESSLLYPDPAWNINVHSLLDKIAFLYGLTEEEIDDIIVAAQQTKE